MFRIDRSGEFKPKKEAHALYGVYDLLVKIKAISFNKLKEIIKLRIQRIAGVTSSLTLMIVEDR
jgi:DNA-binding Lrp family transcriptional regulator